MRPIERKLLQKIDDKGITMDDVLEFIDSASRHEMNLSFPDDCLFQSDRYFAKTILDGLRRYRLIRQDGNRYYKNEKKKQQS